MKILIIGSGGREHAIGWKLKQDNPEAELFFTAGNGGTLALGTNIELNSIIELKEYAKNNSIDLTIVGPEKPLVEGIVDEFQKNNLSIFGATQKAAYLEGSKVFAKDFMKKYGVKTAQYQSFKHWVDARDYINTNIQYPIVIKASGLAAGKGVIICKDNTEAQQCLTELMLEKKLGEAANEVVIEEFLSGFECSLLSIFNGKEIIPFISAKDHKKIGEGETGKNTGGMGVIAPNPLFTSAHLQQFQQDILQPTLKGLLTENLQFAGVIFFGLMINENGVYLLEYNMRLGDPETQAILPLMESNLLHHIQDAIQGKSFQPQWINKHSVCVVMVSGGYPNNFDTGFEIRGLDNIEVPYFIAGAKDENSKLYTAGGRVLNIVATENTLEKAISTCYENVAHINFNFEYYRKDIGLI